jgi:hypothetical protein
MSTPRAVAYDPASAKDRRDELGDATVATVGKDAPMLLAEHLDGRAAVMERVVAVAWTTRRCSDDP